MYICIHVYTYKGIYVNLYICIYVTSLEFDHSNLTSLSQSKLSESLLWLAHQRAAHHLAADAEGEDLRGALARAEVHLRMCI